MEFHHQLITKIEIFLKYGLKKLLRESVQKIEEKSYRLMAQWVVPTYYVVPTLYITNTFLEHVNVMLSGKVNKRVNLYFYFSSMRGGGGEMSWRT